MSDSSKTTRGRPRTVDRDHVAEQALYLYWEHGLFQFSLNELCRQAGISKPSLYREFGGADQLMAAALSRYREIRTRPLLSALNADHPFGEAIEAAIVGLTSDDGTPAGCLFTSMRIVRDRLGDDTRDVVRELEVEQLKAFEAFFQRALDRGDANPELSPAFAARYLDTQLASVLVQMGAGVPPEIVRDQARLALSTLMRHR